MRFLGSTRPARLLPKMEIERLGRIHGAVVGLLRKEFIGEQDVVMLDTSTGTYFAEGLASHNCGPTSVANLVRCVTAGLLGKEEQPTQDDVFDLYRRSGNPDFDPATDADDNGVDMQTMCEALLAGGIGGIKPLCFAKVDASSDAELDAAVSIFGGVLWGVDLETAQQAQTDRTPPVWDYKRSGVWGGHAVLNAAFDESGSTEDVISWALRVETTTAFRKHQLSEAWVVVWEWNVDHPAFQEGIDVTALANAYHALTGKTIPSLPAPTPAPTPSPGGGGDGTFQVGPFPDLVNQRLATKAAKAGQTVEAYLTRHITTSSAHWRT